MSTPLARFCWIRKDSEVTDMARFLPRTSLFCHIGVLAEHTTGKGLFQDRVQVYIRGEGQV